MCTNKDEVGHFLKITKRAFLKNGQFFVKAKTSKEVNVCFGNGGVFLKSFFVY